MGMQRTDLYRGINILKRAYLPGNKFVNVHNVSDVRQVEVHAIKPLVPGPSGLEI
jgi:hypothetical protein